jgi:hypothetical protein
MFYFPKKLIFFIFYILCVGGFLLSFTQCKTQNSAPIDESGAFIKMYGGTKNDSARRSMVNQDGQYAIIGTSESYATEGRSDMFLLVSDKNGNKIFGKSMGGSKGASIRQTKDGDYLLFGTFGDTSKAEKTFMYLVKANKNGDTLWTRKYRLNTLDEKVPVSGITVEITNDNDYMLLGVVDYSSRLSNMYFIKTDQNGNVLREKLYGFEQQYNYIRNMRTGPNNDVVACGDAQFGGKDGVRLTCLNELGNLKWDYNYVPVQSIYFFGYDVKYTGLGYAMVGTAQTQLSPSKTQYFLLVMNTFGQLVFSKNYENEKNREGHVISPTNDGGYIVAGIEEEVLNGVKQRDIFVEKLTNTGEIEWSKKFGSSKDDQPNDIIQQSNGTYLVTATIGFQTRSIMALINLSQNGDFIR